MSDAGGRLLGRGWTSWVYEVAADGPGSCGIVRKTAAESVPGLGEEGDDAELAAAWRREAEALAAAHDVPGVPRLLSARTGGAGAELRLTRMPGTTASHLVGDGGPMHAETVVRVAGAVAAVLGGLHARGWMHLDVNPGNVLVDATSTSLVDFGAAQRIGAPGQWSWPLGRHRFMAPEHVGGRSDAPRRYARLAPASDVYQLASLVAFLVTGREPFEPCRTDEDYRHEYLGRVTDAALRPAAVKVDEILTGTGVRWCLPALLAAWDPEPANRPGPLDFARLLAGGPG